MKETKEFQVLPQWQKLRFQKATGEIEHCVGFGWGRVDFPQGGEYRAVFWICAECKVDNREMFLLLLSRAYTQPRPFHVPTLGKKLGVAWEVTQLREETKLTKGTFQTTWYHTQYVK